MTRKPQNHNDHISKTSIPLGVHHEIREFYGSRFRDYAAANIDHDVILSKYFEKPFSYLREVFNNYRPHYGLYL